MNDQQATLSMPTSIVLASKYAPYVKGKVLDVGCGNAPYKRLFPTCDWTGVDAREGVGDVTADVHELPFEDGSFDTVLCTELLHLAASPILAMQQMARVTKAGGHVVVSTPNVHMEEGNALWGIRIRGLEFLFKQAQLEVVDLQVEGRVFLQEWLSTANFDKFGFTGPEINGWLGTLDKRYPAITAGVATKPPE